MPRSNAGGFIFGFILIPASVALLAGCGPGGSSCLGTGRAQLDASRQGLRYYAGKDLIIVEGTAIETVGKEVDQTSLQIKGVVRFKSVEASVSIQTVPDTKIAHIIDLQPSGIKDQTLIVQVSDDGLVSQVNATSTDKTGEIITNVSKFVAGVAGAFFGIRDPGPDERVVKAIFELTAESKTSDPAKRSMAFERFSKLPVLSLCFLRQSPHGRDLWNHAVRLSETVAIQQAARDQAAADLIASVAKPEFDTIAKRRGLLDEELHSLIPRRDAATTAFQTAMEAFATDESIGSRDNVRKFRYVFDPTELPASASLRSAANETAVEDVLKGFPLAAEMFKQTHSVVSIMGAPTVGASDPPPSATRPIHAMAQPDDKTRIFYREATPVVIDTYAMSTIPDKVRQALDQRVLRIDQKTVMLMHPATPENNFIFDPKVFSNLNLQMAFNKQGRLTGLTQGSTASLAGATGALVNSLQSSRTEFLTAITNIKDVEVARHSIEQANLQNKIDTLTKQKQIVDGKVILQGETADQQLLAQQTLLQNQLAVLQAHQNLTKAQETNESVITTAQLQAQLSELQANQALLKAQASNGLVLQANQLQAQLAELQGEVDFLKKQIELQNLKNTGGK